MSIYNYLLDLYKNDKKCFAVLIDPDNLEHNSIKKFVTKCQDESVDLILIGGSLLIDRHLDEKIQEIKKSIEIPVIIFPGSLNQISPFADAILYLSILSGRNPDYLIGHQVIAAPIIKKLNLEAISTAYLLIESGQTTSVEFMSGTRPIPRDKTDIVLAHALAAEYLGFKLIYLEAGSGAIQSIPAEMIRIVTTNVKIPVIVGGGIKTPDEALEKSQAGANIIVVGNHFEKSGNHNLFKEFARAIHR